MRIGAIDQGTTSTRILVMDDKTGEIHIAASRTHQTRHPKPGHVEQDAREILANIRACIAEALPLDVLGLANQGESCLAWDALTGEPLSPIIVWQDSRTAQDLARLSRVEAARVTALSHLPLDPYFSGSKLGWLIRNVPTVAEAQRRGRLRLGTTDAFYLERLGGAFVTDRATASRTSPMNFSTGAWDAELCGLFGIPIECLPVIRPNIADFGAAEGVPIRAAIVDQQAALYGHGCRAPGELKITFGTGAFALALTDGPVSPDRANGLLPTVAWDLGQGIRYALDGGVYDVGSAIEWAIRGGFADGIGDFQGFDASSAISRGLVVVPAFSGLAAPYWDRSAAPLIIGLAPEMGRRDVCQALLEGIALSVASVVDAMTGVVPPALTLSIDGGVSKSPYFAQFLADCLGRRVDVRSFADQTALGVALLAAGTERGGLADDLNAGTSFHPRSAIRQLFGDRYTEAVARSRNWRDGSSD